MTRITPERRKKMKQAEREEHKERDITLRIEERDEARKMIFVLREKLPLLCSECDAVPADYYIRPLENVTQQVRTPCKDCVGDWLLEYASRPFSQYEREKEIERDVQEEEHKIRVSKVLKQTVARALVITPIHETMPFDLLLELYDLYMVDDKTREREELKRLR